jgi:hypothetical protein
MINFKRDTFIINADGTSERLDIENLHPGTYEYDVDYQLPEFYKATFKNPVKFTSINLKPENRETLRLGVGTYTINVKDINEKYANDPFSRPQPKPKTKHKPVPKPQPKIFTPIPKKNSEILMDLNNYVIDDIYDTLSEDSNPDLIPVSPDQQISSSSTSNILPPPTHTNTPTPSPKPTKKNSKKKLIIKQPTQ